MTFRFAYPLLLFLLIAVALWIVLAWRRKPRAIAYSMTSQLVRVSGLGGRIATRIPTILRGCVLALLVLAGARPQFYNISRDVRSSGVDIMLAIDTSGSMEALDFKLGDQPVTRLAAVKKVVGDFIKRRETDRIGIVVFGEGAYTQSPLTIDKGLLLGLVDRMTIGMAGDRTALGLGIAVAGKRLKDLQAKSRALIVLTDGRHNAGEITPLEAAEAVRALGAKIYTIGVGGKGPAPFRVKTPLGTRVVHQEVDLDEETLKKVAERGGGRYFRAADTRSLAEICRIIDREEKTEVNIKEFLHSEELYVWCLVPALLLFVVEMVLRSWVLRVVP